MEQPTWIGRSLNGRYKIDALLGSGGMSAVYKAFDPNLRRVVAIKLIHPHLSTDIDFIYRFKKKPPPWPRSAIPILYKSMISTWTAKSTTWCSSSSPVKPCKTVSNI